MRWKVLMGSSVGKSHSMRLVKALPNFCITAKLRVKCWRPSNNRRLGLHNWVLHSREVQVRVRTYLLSHVDEWGEWLAVENRHMESQFDSHQRSTQTRVSKTGILQMVETPTLWIYDRSSCFDRAEERTKGKRNLEGEMKKLSAQLQHRNWKRNTTIKEQEQCEWAKRFVFSSYCTLYCTKLKGSKILAQLSPPNQSLSSNAIQLRASSPAHLHLIINL